jgi:hypothetical protein
MEVLADCVEAKKHLVPYWRRNLVNKEVIADQVFMQPSDFLESELAPEVADLEATLPISALIALRQYAAQEAVIEIKRLRASPSEMKKYVEEHHLDPEKEGGENAKGKFWGLGKIAKLGKKNEFDDFIPGEKKKKGILKSLFKRVKSSKKPKELEDSQHNPDEAEDGLTPAKSSKKGEALGAAGFPVGSVPGEAGKSAGVLAKKEKKVRSGTGDDTDAEGELSDLEGPEDGAPLDGDIDLEHALGLHDDKADGEGEGEVDGPEQETEEPDEEKLMADLQAALMKSTLDADQAFTLRVKLATSLTLRVNLGAQTIVTVTMALRFCNEKRRNLQRFIIELDNLSIRDMVSTKPIFKYLVTTDKALLNSKVLRRASILQTSGTVVIPQIEFSKADKVGDGFADGSAQFQLLFEKKKGDSVEKGKTILCVVLLAVSYRVNCHF